MAAQYAIHDNQSSSWEKQLLEAAKDLFSDHREHHQNNQEELMAELHRQIDRLKVELDWLEQKSAISTRDKRMLIEPSHPDLSVSQQCDLLG